MNTKSQVTQQVNPRELMTRYVLDTLGTVSDATSLDGANVGASSVETIFSIR